MPSQDETRARAQLYRDPNERPPGEAEYAAIRDYYSRAKRHEVQPTPRAKPTSPLLAFVEQALGVAPAPVEKKAATTRPVRDYEQHKAIEARAFGSLDESTRAAVRAGDKDAKAAYRDAIEDLLDEPGEEE